MSYTYASFQTALAQMMAVPNANVNAPNFVIILPTIIDYAEQRCYRDLDLLNATLTVASALTALQRVQSLAPATGAPILILESFNIVDSTGARTPLYPTSREWIDSIYGGPSTAAMPRFYGMVDDQDVVLGPWPDQAYNCEFIGKFRPIPLYNATPAGGAATTYLTSVLPDLFLAAAMVSASAYQKNFGAQADNPQQALSWETQYQTLLQTAKLEEMRKKQHGWQALTSESTPPPTPQPIPGG